MNKQEIIKDVKNNCNARDLLNSGWYRSYDSTVGIDFEHNVYSCKVGNKREQFYRLSEAKNWIYKQLNNL